MLSTLKNEEVLGFLDVAKFKRTSRRIAAFSSLQLDRQADKQIDR